MTKCGGHHRSFWVLRPLGGITIIGSSGLRVLDAPGLGKSFARKLVGVGFLHIWNCPENQTCEINKLVC